MKKFLLIAVAAFGMLMTACSKDEVAQPVVEKSTVTFTVEAPVMATRAALGDGTSATELNWAVYDTDGNYLFGGKEDAEYKKPLDNELKATVDIPFVNGMAYNILFWAEAPGTESPYTVDWEAKTVGYTNAADLDSNSEDYDAFYCYYPVPVVTGPITETVELKRPFAQLNIKTNDAKKAKQSGVEVEKVAVTVKKGYNAFDFVSGNGININQDAVTFRADAAQAAADDDGVQLLAVNYLFTGGEKSLVDVEFTYTDGDLAKGGDASGSMEFASVPVQRNYRTNIVGSLLTSDGKFNIVTLPGFDGEQGVVDGNNYIKVATAAELNAALNDSTVDEIILEEDVVLSEILTIGVPTRADTEAVVRNLTIDGNGKTLKSSAGRAINVSGVDGVTIKNLNIECSGERAINIIQNATNVTIENVTATAANYTVNVAASAPNAVVAINGSTLNGLCTVNVAAAGAEVTVDGCTVNCNDNNTTEGESYAALSLNKAAVGGKITVTDSTINVTAGSDSKIARNGAEDGEITIDGSIDDVTIMVAAITYEGSDYYHAFETLEAAVEFAKEGDTVTLIRDIEQEDGVLITDKNITIDLNNKSFTVSEGASTNNRNFKINGESVVTIKNGTLVAQGQLTSGAYGTIRTEDTATVTLNDVKLYSYRGFGLNVKAYAGTKVTINDSEIHSQYSGGVEAAGGEIVLNDVIIDQNGVYSSGAWCSVAIGVNGSGKVVVNSGTYSAKTIAEDANAAQGTWVAYVMSSGGTLEINGGTFNGGDSAKATATAADACGIICADRAAVVNIYGGTFNAKRAILDMRNNVGSLPNPIATLYGGNFSHNPTVSGLYSSNLIKADEGKIAVQQANGRWTLVDGVATAEALAEAVAAGGNVVLGADITVNEPVVIEGKTVVLDLNGKTLTAPATSALVANTSAELTVKNGKVIAYESTVRAIGGKATIESGEYTSTGTAADTPATYRYSIDCREGGEIIINGGTFKSNNGMINVGSTVTINGGKFENIVEKSMTRHFAYVSAPLTINDGEFYGKANSGAGGCFFCGAGAGCDIQVKGGKFTSLWMSGSVNRIFEVYFGGTINVTGGLFNTNGGIANFVTENTDEATKGAYPYKAK